MSDLKDQIALAFSEVFGIPAVVKHLEALLADKMRVSKLESLLTNSAAITNYTCLRTLLLALSPVVRLTEMYKYPDSKTYFTQAFTFLMDWYETEAARDLHQIGVSQRRELETAARRLIQCMHKTVRNSASKPVLFDLNLSVVNLGHEYCIRGSFRGAPAFNGRAKELIEQERVAGSRTKTIFCIQCGSALEVPVSKTPKKLCENCAKNKNNSDTKFCQRCGKSYKKSKGMSDRTWNSALICHACKEN